MSGVAPARLTRKSDLLFGWDAKYRSLDAYTGQVGRFSVVIPGTALPVTGRNGAALDGGHGMPRWVQETTHGTVTRLLLTGDVGGADVERIEWDWPLGVMALSMYVKTWPGYAAGLDVGGTPGRGPLLSLGNDNTGPTGGVMSLRRLGTTWDGLRGRNNGSSSVAVTESGASVFPIEVLFTLSAAGTIQVSTRTAAGVTVVSGAFTSAAYMTAGENWTGPILYATGGNFRYEKIKIARGVQTFTTLDLLS